jgi:hypothetical protein
VGVLGLSPSTIEEMTIGELMEAIAARYAYDQALQRQAWEQARTISYFALAPHVKKGSISSPRDLFSFPWDGAGKKPRSIGELSEAAKEWIRKHDEKDGIKTDGV